LYYITIKDSKLEPLIIYLKNRRSALVDCRTERSRKRNAENASIQPNSVFLIALPPH